MNVTLLSVSPKPLESLYAAYRVCYSSDKPEDTWNKILKEEIPVTTISKFVNSRLQTGHDSPLRQIQFEFAISGVSRALTHQLVRHSIGWNFEQQSQRYVTFKDYMFEHVTPVTIEKSEFNQEYRDLHEYIMGFYSRMIEKGIPNEDARFILTNSATSNLKLTVSLPALQHFCDIRLCTRAQWEIRNLAQKMRVQATRAVPWIMPFFGIKCEANRTGYCDEDKKDWEKCPLSKSRPHKSNVIK